MKFYLAPLEGITGYIYRNAYDDCFHSVDKYFTPFIAANPHGKCSSREWSDICNEHNTGKTVIPQILTNKSEDFIATARMLQSIGYNEVNLNLGCPSGTVVSKNRGSGFLSKPDDLQRFLEEVFSALDMKVSLKTRIGKDSPEEFARLMEIYNQYPLEELIIHPRIQKDYYKNKPNLTVFKEAFENASVPIVYNGDIFTVKDYHNLLQICPDLSTLMLGRGIIANPGLVGEIITGKMMNKEEFRAFHDRLLEGYKEVLYGDRNVLFKMKEAWFYMNYMFSNVSKYVKKIRKSQNLQDYTIVVDQLFMEQELVPGAGLFFTPSSIDEE